METDKLPTNDVYLRCQVAMPYAGDRTLLGDVVAVRKNKHGRTVLTVKHFNGEPWPVEPHAAWVRVIG